MLEDVAEGNGSSGRDSLIYPAGPRRYLTMTTPVIVG